MNQTSQTIIDLPPASLLRRLAAIFYDSLLVGAVIFVTTAIYHAVINNWLLGLKDAPAGFNPLLSTIITFVTFMFFAHFWSRNGQTLGMQAWRLKIYSTETGQPLTLMQCLLRFMVAIPALGLAGLGMLWMLVDKKKMTWHDHYSMSRIVLLPKR